MLQVDYQQFCDFMRKISNVTVLANDKNLEDTIKTLFLFLENYSFEAVKNAVMRHCSESKYFPMLADIVQQIQGTVEERAALAWALVLKAKKKYRMRKSIRFPNPAIHFAIEKMGGWEHLYTWLTDEAEDFKAKIFKEYYRIGEKVAAWDNVCAYFVGDDEKYLKQYNRLKTREVYDVENEALVPENSLPALR